MTPKTLTQERKQKFSDVLSKYLSNFVISHEDANKLLDELVEASKSRSEIAGEYKTLGADLEKAEKEAEARKFNAPVFRGDWRDYPEHLHKIAECLRDVWMFVLPEKPQKANRKTAKSKYAFFIMSMESIKESCGEFGVKALEETHKKWRAGFKNGIAPYAVATPQSLVNMVASTAREMRESGISEMNTKPQSRNLND